MGNKPAVYTITRAQRWRTVYSVWRRTGELLFELVLRPFFSSVDREFCTGACVLAQRGGGFQALRPGEQSGVLPFSDVLCCVLLNARWRHDRLIAITKAS